MSLFIFDSLLPPLKASTTLKRNLTENKTNQNLCKEENKEERKQDETKNEEPDPDDSLERALSREVADALASASIEESLVELAGNKGQKDVPPKLLPNGSELTVDNVASFFLTKAANMPEHADPSFWQLELEGYIGDLEPDHQNSLVLQAKGHLRLNDHVKTLNHSAGSNPDEDDWKWGCCEESCVEELAEFIKWLVLVAEDPNQSVQKVRAEDMSNKIDVSNKKAVDEAENTTTALEETEIPEETVQEKNDLNTGGTIEQKDLKVEVEDQKNVEETHHPVKIAMMDIILFKMHMKVIGRIEFEEQPTEDTKQCQEFQDWLPKKRSYTNALGAYGAQIIKDPMFAEFRTSVMEKYGLDEEWDFNGPESDPELDIRDWYGFLLQDPKRKDTLLSQLPVMIEIARKHPLFEIGFVKKCGIDPQSFGESPDADYAKFDKWTMDWNDEIVDKETQEETNLQEDQDDTYESEDQNEEEIAGTHHEFPKPAHEHAPDINILLESAAEVRYECE